MDLQPQAIAPLAPTLQSALALQLAPTLQSALTLQPVDLQPAPTLQPEFLQVRSDPPITVGRGDPLKVGDHLEVGFNPLITVNLDNLKEVSLGD